MEFIVKKGRKCVSYGNCWLGSVMDTRIPRPFPDIETSRYKSVFESPACLDGKPRPVDDYMPRAQIKKYFAEGKLATVKEIAEFSVAFVVSEELVKNYIDHLKHLSYCKNLRTQETAQKRRTRASKSYGDYNWEELLLTEGLNSLYVSELDLYLKNHSLPWKKKLKKEKLELITTHLKETRAEALRAMTVTGQRLLQEPKE